MASGRFAATGKTRLIALLAALAVVGGAAAPIVPTRVERAAAQAGSAIIGRSADGVLLRAEPDYGAEVVATLAEGTVIGLRTDEADTVYDPDGTTRWWPVATESADGWVQGFFLQVVGAPAPPDAPVAPAAAEQTTTDAGQERAAEDPTDPPHLGWSTARVADPEGVNLRAEPGTDAESLASLRLDTPVELRIDEADTVWADGGRWWPVRVDGQDGWILGSYLAPDGGEAAPATAAQEVPAAEAPAEQAPAEEPPAEQAPADAPGKEAPVGPLFSVGSYVQAVTDDGTGLNIRADGAPDAERVGIVPENDVVQVMDGPFLDPTGTGWYLITGGDVTGYVISTYLEQAEQPAPPDDGDQVEIELPEAPEAPEAPEIPAPDLEPRPGLPTGRFIEPVGGYTFTQGYGCSPYWFEPWEPAMGCNFHNGIDLANVWGTPLLAADGGVVEYSGWCDCGLGYYVKIDHGNGFKTVYGHMAELWVSTSESVGQGDRIGAMGSTGNSTGPHVHFIVELNGSTVDPLGYL
ncbi:MAG: peptidoglycan DD-metalloendopeptidase family protein [Chloroflexota bacterium]|nr:peptidoglycan DD-metalloendopeptidase family protein [Chloroflexota bacterium]